MRYQFTKERARESRVAIERIYVTMRHLFNRGSYKPYGISGNTLISSLMKLSPEIYGKMNDNEQIEIDGLTYVIDRLPKGIEECRLIRLITKEGFEDGGFEIISPPKRRRNCYRIDKERMYIEMTRGRSDIYDILTHLTFFYVEANKIKNNALDQKGKVSPDWLRLKEIIELEQNKEAFDHKQASSYLSNIIGLTYKKTRDAVEEISTRKNCYSLYHLVYWMGKLAIEEEKKDLDREITFSSRLRETIGQHIYGESWANSIKEYLQNTGFINKPIHIISANLHSFMNVLYGHSMFNGEYKNSYDLAANAYNNGQVYNEIFSYACENGMEVITDHSGTNLTIQVFDLSKVDFKSIPELSHKQTSDALLLVMDYAFGEQAFECMDELLKPIETADENINLDIQSISIMGKAGILEGEKGDVMIPTAHVFEGTADNYPFDNDFDISDFQGQGLQVFKGSMVTVLGTSLQNRDVLQHFKTSTWNAVGIEMEGAHYQKAVQSASKIRRSINEDVKVRYAYYASDNPLVTGKTLSSGSLGPEGIKPTYLITINILNKIFKN